MYCEGRLRVTRTSSVEQNVLDTVQRKSSTSVREFAAAVGGSWNSVHRGFQLGRYNILTDCIVQAVLWSHQELEIRRQRKYFFIFSLFLLTLHFSSYTLPYPCPASFPGAINCTRKDASIR
ncbi:hypothetical protein TNCV_603601 [Trichonephila clavipes]|nr:hypothetical protein TNCV_603601 [Trichonephila clavipes]